MNITLSLSLLFVLLKMDIIYFALCFCSKDIKHSHPLKVLPLKLLKYNFFKHREYALRDITKNI